MLYQVHNNITGALILLKFLDVKMNEIKPGCTRILLKFKDSEVSQEKYLFLKGRLEDLKCYMDKDYSIKLGFQYTEHVEQLIIEVTILTPEHLLPKDIESAIKIFMDHLGTFENFYEAQCLIFDKSLSKASG
jgi:hypothetical protein